MPNDTDLAQPVPLDDEIDLREVLSALWVGKAQIAAGVIITTLVAIAYAFYLPDKYSAEALLAPRNDSVGGGALGQFASQYGGIAGISGLQLGGADSQNRTAIAIEMLKSREFFSRYLYDLVLVNLMASKGWDRKTDQVILDEEIFKEQTGKWVRKVGGAYQVKPSKQEAHEIFLQDFFSIFEDSQSGFVTVTVTHYSPSVARDWVEKIVMSVNEAVRAREVSEAKNSIAFLSEQSQRTNLVSLTGVFAKLIEQQTKTVMLANATDEYVFRVIDPPVAPEIKAEPNRVLITLLGALVGGVFATLLALVSYYRRG